MQLLILSVLEFALSGGIIIFVKWILQKEEVMLLRMR